MKFKIFVLLLGFCSSTSAQTQAQACCPKSATQEKQQALWNKFQERIAEVEDFVDFLQAKDQERKLRRAAMQVAEPKLASVWDNDDDAAYDKL